MKIEIKRKDIIWSYAAKMFSIGSGFITLPLILHLLTPEEIGMNYLMLTISSMIGFLDFGFSPQFGRNFTYVSSGAQKLKRQGIEENINGNVNYHLLATMIKTAKFVYRRLAIVSLLLMLIGGIANLCLTVFYHQMVYDVLI